MALRVRHDQQTRQQSHASSCICGGPSRRLMISRLRVAMLCFNYVYTQPTCILPPPALESSSRECQERAKGSACISKSACAKGKWRKGESAGKCSVNRAGFEKKKKEKSSVREMRQRRLWSSRFHRDWRLLFEVSTVRQRSAADGNLLKSVFPTAGSSSSARGHLSTQTRQCVAIASSLKQCSLSDYSLLTPFNK